MAYKTHNKLLSLPYSRGFISIIEMVLVLSIFVLVVSALYFSLNISNQLKKGRDERRLSNLYTLQRILEEYILDNDQLPDSPNALRTSNTLPSGNSGPLVSPLSGWISGNFSAYNNTLPIDPINDNQYFFLYKQDGHSYEINAKLEFLTDEMQNDGGNNLLMYEVGTDLFILN